MASFTANAAFLGTPEFNVIDIDPRQIASGLQKYLERGSKLTGVSLEDIDRSVSSMPASVDTVTLTELLTKGMKLFDALVWLTAQRPKSHPLKVDPTKTVDSIPSMHTIARAVFYVYFFLLTQARYPVRDSSTAPPAVANFLRIVMGMQAEQSVYINTVCSFEPQKFDAAWVKFVDFGNFGQEALSRFGLGVAGYRMFSPFKIYKPRDDISDDLKNAVAFARAVAIAGPSWDVHPLTRKPDVLTRRGNLNKNLANLIGKVYTPDQIDEMVKSKMLYEKPKAEPAYMNYLTWSAVDDISGNAPIFR